MRPLPLLPALALAALLPTPSRAIEPYRAETVQPYRAETVQPYRADTVQPYRGQGTIQPHQGPGTIQPHQGPGTIQPHQGPGTVESHRGPGTVQPERGQVTVVPSIPAPPPAQEPKPAPSPESYAFAFRTFSLRVPGAAYVTPGPTRDFDVLHTSPGANTQSRITVRPNGTYVWDSKWDGRVIRGKWTRNGDGTLRLFAGQEGKEWTLGRSTEGTWGGGDVYLFSGSTWYTGTALKK